MKWKPIDTAPQDRTQSRLKLICRGCHPDRRYDMTDVYIKLSPEILDLASIGSLPDHTWRRCIEIFLLAARDNLGSTLTLPLLPDLAWMLRVGDGVLLQDLQELEKAGVVQQDGETWKIVSHHWVVERN